MLARVLLGICAMMFSSAFADEQPDVFIIQSTSGDLKLDAGWKKTHGSYLASSGSSATQAAILFGNPPLQYGVVADLDWRRKATISPSLANKLQTAGYQTSFYGAWALGSTPPYNPASRGFDQAQYFESADRDTLADPWQYSKATPKWVFENRNLDKPFFAFISEGRHLSRYVIIAQLQDWIEKRGDKNARPVVVIILEAKKPSEKAYHYPAKWHCFTKGDVKLGNIIETDFDLNRALEKLLGMPSEPESGFKFFHKANWPVNESPEKYRHRGSLVIGKGLALVDGLRLFPAKNLAPDLAKEMDISKHTKEHQELLTAHAKWWQTATQALHDPRAFDVGKKNGQVVQLTAQDWRTTKIIHPDGTSPTSAPMFYQKDLLAILEGLSDEKYKQSFPAYSGSWAVNILQPGRYKITASLLPSATTDPAHKSLMKLQGGTAHIKLGSNKVQLRLIKGATAVSVKTDADAGVTTLESWFTGQLSLTRELGAFFVEIERIGDKKFGLKAKAK